MKKLSMDELNRLSVDRFKESDKNSIIVALDDVRSQHNIGSVFRTADAFRVEKIILGGYTATPPNREIQKTALGATESVDWEYSKILANKIKDLKDKGYIIVSIEQVDISVSLEKFNWDKLKKYAVVFGNEVKGVNNDIISLSDYCVEIPQFGTKHSFNISVSAGIVLWDYFLKNNSNF